jgi:hypothetical protein
VIVLLHRLNDFAAERGEDAGLKTQTPSMQGRASDQPTEHVSAELIGRHDAVGDEERRGARVLRDDPDRHVGVAIRAVLLTR